MEKSIGSLAFWAVFSCLIMVQCKFGQQRSALTEPVFHPEIAAFTAGVISGTSVITIELSREYDGPFEVMAPIHEKLFDFKPSIRGKAYWINAKTIEFRPDQRLPNAQVYEARFYIGKIRNLPKEQIRFEFSFQTIAQSFTVEFDGMQSIDSDGGEWNRYQGVIITSDHMEAADVSRLLKAYQGQQALSVQWEQNQKANRHTFTIDSLQRKQAREYLKINWDGHALGMHIAGERIIEVPALGDFSVMDVRIVQHPEQHVLVYFSDPLSRSQTLTGLVTLAGTDNPRLLIEGNRLHLYPPVRLSGNYVLTLSEGLQSRQGHRLAHRYTFDLVFEDIKPAVRLSGRGVILPGSDALIFPFEAVNLRAVDLRIIKIFESNVGQFLQVNALDGDYELKRAGRLILQRTIDLTSDRPVDYGRWNSFSFDLSKLINSEPGAIYRVEIGFKKEYSLYPCGEASETVESLRRQQFPDEQSDAMAYWDNPDMYWDPASSYGWWDPGYVWEERDNPCHPSYYGQQRTVSRNVLASNLGVIAKGGNDQTMLFAVSDLRTSAPLAGVQLDVYNYQNQLTGSIPTQNDGMAQISLESKPYLLVASLGKQRGYLRLDDGSSLSLSRFDVSGAEVQKGLKGFIYADRGVWRPGDSLHIMFVLEDRQKVLPAEHPVIFELYNPSGQLVKRQSATSGMNGFYNFSTSSDRDAPTGNWRAQVKVGGTEFSRILKIETVKPNRLKINLGFGTSLLGVHLPDAQGKIHAGWLHGAPARNLRAHVAVTLNQISTKFPAFPAYQFDDPSKSFESEEVSIFDGRLDNEGNALFSPGISTGQAAPGLLQAHFVSRVFEEGGDFSVDRYSLPYSPYPAYIGLKLPAGEPPAGLLYNDTDHLVEVVSLDSEGLPVSLRRLDVKVYKLEWRWWWDASHENLASYMGNVYPEPVFSTSISTGTGRGSFQFRIPHPEWGRYLVRVSDPQGGHSTGQVFYIDWPGWEARSAADDPQAAAMLSISTDKERYRVGEQVYVSLPSVKSGRALISLESGSRVLQQWWHEFSEGESQFSFKATAGMAPNVYLFVSLIQPHMDAVNDLPIRMYGVVPVFVEDPDTKLTPLIDMPESLVPGQAATVKIREASGKKMTYTIAVVDEGLLDLTRFPTPDPWNAFYAREALGVKTWDVYDQVIGAYGGRIEQVFSIGGDEGIVGRPQPQANRFRPMVKFLGPFTLEKGKSRSHSFEMPEYIGSVRVMVVAGNQGAYGNAEKTVQVKKPLMVLATMPRMLSPGEKLSLPVTIFSMDEQLRDVRVELKVNELFSVAGERVRQLRFSQTGEMVIYFDVEVRQAIGTGKVAIECASGSETASTTVEISVRNPNQPIVSITDALIKAGSEQVLSYSPLGIAGTNSAVLELSVIPPVDFGRRLKYLIDYPHGCLEQVASSAFPQLFIGSVMEMDEALRRHTESNIKEAIRLIASYQRADGGLRYWPGVSEISEWAHSFAGHFMLEAAMQGYALPLRFRESWIAYQSSQARNWSPGLQDRRFSGFGQDDLLQAYRLYTLALANAPEQGAMNRLREFGNLSLQARWRLAAAYALVGQAEAAQQLVDGISWQIDKYQAFNATYGSAERDMAMILETLVLMKQAEKAMPVARAISEALSGQGWMSTQTTAYCLLAMSKYAGGQADRRGVKAAYALNEGREVNIDTGLFVAQASLNDQADQNVALKIQNKGGSALFARLISGGLPATDAVVASENQLQIRMNYLDLNGNAISIDQLPQGTDFLAEVWVGNPGRLGNYTDMVLTQIFPSGWEIRNVRMDEVASAYQGNVPRYQDFRDDRIHTHFDLDAGQSKKFVVMLHAAYPGRYYLPTTFCEAMYQREIYARLPGRWVDVVMPGQD